MVSAVISKPADGGGVRSVAIDLSELRRFAIKRHVRLGYNGDEIPNGGSCAICMGEWGEGFSEQHARTCPVVGRALPPLGRGEGISETEIANIIADHIDVSDEALKAAGGALGISGIGDAAAETVRRLPQGGGDATVVWLREIDAGTDNACWAICNQVDSGALPFVLDASLPSHQRGEK